MADEQPTQAVPPAPTGSPGLVDRAKNILMQPKAEWERISAETTEPAKLLTGYVLPLALIGPAASLIGMQLFGINVLFTTIKPSLTTSLTIAVMSFVMAIVGAFVLAFIANFLSPKFGGRDSFPSAFRLVAYAMTAAWVGGIFGLIPSLALIGSLIGLYSLYLLYAGASPVMGVPADKAVGYTVVTIVAAIVVYIVMGTVTAAISGNMMASALTANDAGTINLGELGSVSVDGENSTVDLGALGKVEMDGDTATLTVDGQEVEVNVKALEAQAAALEAQAQAAQAE
jgi:hypothetical protein